MTKPLTKEQRAEMRPGWLPAWQNYPHSGWSMEEARKVNRYLVAIEDSHALVDEALTAANNQLGNLLAVIHRDGGHYQSAYGTAKACEDAEKLSASRIQAEELLDLATAKLATAKVCEVCGGKGKRLINNCVAGTVATYEIKCPHCTNGVVISDERARELLERLKRAEKDSDLLDWLEGEYEREHAAMAMGAHTTSIFRKNLPITRGAIRAARAKEGKE